MGGGGSTPQGDGEGDVGGSPPEGGGEDPKEPKEPKEPEEESGEAAKADSEGDVARYGRARKSASLTASDRICL
eukprot:885478-Prorocentrum_minimum.AAC.1